MNFLDDVERTQLKTQHKKERDKKICDRIKAVLLYDKGWSFQKIAEALLLTEQAIRQHVDEYKSSKKLKPEGGGSEEKLSAEQSEQLEAHLQEQTYLYVKDVTVYVQVTFGTTYTVPGMRSWLQRHGFSYKKPAVVPGKANKEQQQKWLADYGKLRQGLPGDETICFIDGVHPTHNVQPAYGWIKKGVRKEIPANTGRSRLNLSGAIDVISHNVVIREDRTLNAESTIHFFQKIEEAYPGKRKIHVFCDNAPFLPPYSPNLNPIERLWKWMKERVIYNVYYRDFEDFKGAVLGFFAALATLAPDSILGQSFRCRVRDKFRPVGAPGL